MGVVGFAIAALVIGLGVVAGRWLASRAFGIRGFRPATNTEEERGRPALAFARALAAIVGVYLACVLLFVPGFASGGTTVVDDTSMRVTAMPGGPAASAGILNGDRIVSVNGEQPNDWPHLKKIVGAHPDEVLDVEVERAGERRSFPVKAVGPKIMIAPSVEKKSLSAGEVLGEAFVAPLQIAKAFFGSLARVLSGTDKPELSGPVGISREMTAAAQAGTSVFLKLTAAIAAYQALLVDLALLVIAFVMGILPRRNSVLPTSGNSS